MIRGFVVEELKKIFVIKSETKKGKTPILYLPQSNNGT